MTDSGVGRDRPERGAGEHGHGPGRVGGTPLADAEPGGRLALKPVTLGHAFPESSDTLGACGEPVVPMEPARGEPDPSAGGAECEVLGTIIGYQPPDADPWQPAARHGTVLWRAGDSPSVEADHLQGVATRLLSLSPETIITYGGREFDLPTLRERARAAARFGHGRLADTLESQLDRATHVDLQQRVDSAAVGRPLSAVCGEAGIFQNRPRLTDYDHGHPLEHRGTPTSADRQPALTSVTGVETTPDTSTVENGPPTLVPGALPTARDVLALGAALVRRRGGCRTGPAGAIDPGETDALLADHSRSVLENLFALAARHPD